MNKVFIVLASIFLVGCASNNEIPKYTAPSVVAVKNSVEKLKPLVKPEGKKAVESLEMAIKLYEYEVDQQAKALAKAQNDAAYWHGKQEKALRELWTWRLIALFVILCVVAYIGIKTSWRFLR
jgi:hypothetical protein